MFIQFQFKGKTKTMLVMILANIFFVTSSAFILDWVGAGICGLAVFRNIVFILCDIKRKPIPRWLHILTLVLFLGAAAAIMSFTWTWWYNWVCLGGQLILIYGCWQKNTNLLRVANAIYSSAMIYHLVVVNNWVLTVVEVAVLLSVLIFYLRRIIFRKRPRNLVIDPTHLEIRFEDDMYISPH